jgi:hypothetical protein
MSYQRQSHLALLGYMSVFAKDFKGFAWQIAAVQQGQSKIFSKSGIARNGNQNFQRCLMYQQFQIGIPRQDNFDGFGSHARRLWLLRRFLQIFYVVAIVHRRTPRCAAISSAPSTGRT